MERRDTIEEATESLEPREGSVATTDPQNKRPFLVAAGLGAMVLAMVFTAVSSDPDEGEEFAAAPVEEASGPGIAGDADMANQLREDAERNRPEPVYADPEPPQRSGHGGGGELTFAQRLRQGRENARLQRILQREQRQYDARVAAQMGDIHVDWREGAEGAGSPGQRGGSMGGSPIAGISPQTLALHQQGLAYHQARAALGAGAGGIPGAGIPGVGELGVAPVPDAQRRQDFYQNGGDQLRPGQLHQQVRGPATPYEIKMGAVIPGILETEMNSDTPGMIRGRVREDVRDFATGRHILIPQGSMLVGTYNADVGSAQVRVQIAWNRINFPDGSTLDLEGMAGADQAGASGFRDRVNRHVGRRIGMALLMTSFAIPYEMASRASAGGLNNTQSALAAGVGESLVQFGTEAIRDEMDRPNTITIRPGYQFNIQVEKDIVFRRPYGREDR